ncbi:MAG: hypothetical protein U9P36_08165 [Thermodesulfobacteriota bacterium]|nr:hypothetical protein [Thermodesulfobacteriota bacterium]
MSCFRCWFLCSSIFCLLLVGGCGSKLPRTVAVSGPDLDLARSRLTRFFDQSCVTAIDSDVRLGWQAYGQLETYPATLQATAPAFLRFAVVDPLGRPLLLLASNGSTFVLADNRKGVGYTGMTDSDFIHQFLPEGIVAHDLFFWLSGRIRQDGLQILSARKAEDGTLFWYEIDYGDRLIHLLGLDQGQLSRHLVLDENDTILFDAQYSGYFDTSEDCDWPGKIVASGDGLAADFTLEFAKIYSYSPLGDQLFQLQLPPHFAVRNVQ